MYKYILFTVYTLVYECIVWGLFGWAVFIKGYSGWWLLLAVYMSGNQLKPRHFGIKE